MFLIEGEHLIEEAYKAGLLKTIFFVNNNPYFDIENYQVSEQVISKLSSVKNNQGIVGICSMKANFDLSNKILLLDHIQDPGNMGTLIRSAIAFGFNTIVLDECVDVYNPKVVRSTQGALFKIHLIEKNIVDFIKEYNDYYYLATNLSSSNNLSDLKIQKDKIGLILGNEGQGVRDKLIDLANIDFKIEMKSMESLNVSIAGSIIMHKLN
ncbi:MAG: RNA methyltransferase [Candidatus Izimaplasma sp.]|nr:RNA methyltransferase [Candidatus Izimaplasma bacterium]